MLKPYQWPLAIAFLFCCLSSKVNGSVRFVHSSAHRRPNATHVIPAQVHQVHHHVRHNQTWIRSGGKFNHTQSGPAAGWQIIQRNASLTSSNPWPTGQRNSSWTTPGFQPQQPLGGVAPPAPIWTHHNQTTWSGPAYNQTTWRTVTTNQTHYGWPQGQSQSQQPSLGIPIPVNFPLPGNIWAPPSPTYNSTFNGTLTTFNSTSTLPVGNQQFAALSPPNAGATYIGGNPSPSVGGSPPKPNANSSNPYANLFN